MTEDGRSRDFETLAAQAGIRMRIGHTISTAPAIDPSTTFTYESVDQVHRALGPEPEGFAYARNANPTVTALEEAMASLEGAEDVVAFGSGMAAIAAVFQGLQIGSGDVVVCSSSLYGGTRSLLTQLMSYEVETRFVDILDLESVDSALAESRARVLYFESMTNPLVEVPDTQSLTGIAQRFGASVVVDNTFATPFLFRPLRMGVDVVVHSASKYIAGHGDVLAGLVAGNRSIGQMVRGARTVSGGVLSPFEAWLTLRGVRTLPLRMSRQSESALEIAHWLADRDWVERVYYPGLPAHPQHDTARREFGGRFGGMLAFDLRGDQAAALRFMDALRILVPGTSLGDVESLVLYPPLSSHRQLDEEQLQKIGIGQGLIRMSVGLESPKDLMADLESAARTAIGRVDARALSAR